MFELICMGELLVDFIPIDRSKSLRDSSGFRPAPGGAPANVAAAFALLGGRASLISRLGNDPFGHYLFQAVNSAGVDTSMLKLTDEALTGLAFVFLDESGENDFLFYRNPSADMLIKPDELDLKAIEQASIFHFGSISLLGGRTKDSTLWAAARAAESKTVVSFDPNLRPALWPSLEQAREAINLGLQRTNILKLSRSELSFIMDSPSIAAQTAAANLFERYPPLKVIAVTEAEKGSTIFLPGLETPIPPVRVKSVDPTGAGDAYMGALLFYMHSNFLAGNSKSQAWPQSESFWLKAGTFANTAGALTVTNSGAITAMPDYQTVIKTMQKKLP